MNTETENQRSNTKIRMKPKNDYLRIQRETKKKILAELSELNRKDFGKPITPDDYVALAVSLMTEEHKEELKKRSLTNQDRLKKEYREYCAKHSKISMDDFIGILLAEHKE